MAEASISLYFGWTMYRPDQRTYRQNSIELFPRTKPYPENENWDGSFAPPLVKIEVPLQGEYLANAKDIIEKQLSGLSSPAPILTLAGMRYVQDQFDAVLYDTEVPEDDEAPKATTEGGGAFDDGWVNGAWDQPESGTTSVATGPDAAKEDEWAEAVTDDDKNAPWKEDWGN